MIKIVNNYIVFQKQRDFNNRILKYFYERLAIFLCTDVEESPSIIFTSNINKIKHFYGDMNVVDYGRAFYDEIGNNVVFDANRYNILNKELFSYSIEATSESIGDVGFKYKYVIPLSDVYHELCHKLQHQSGIYEYTDFLEGTDEFITYFITGHYNIDYYREALSIWYIAREILGIQRKQLYNFIRDCIVDYDYLNKYFMNNKQFIKLLGTDYNGNITKFMNNFKNDLYYPSYKTKFERELKYIHDLIFYRY